jgi:hypothetical protein
MNHRRYGLDSRIVPSAAINTSNYMFYQQIQLQHSIYQNTLLSSTNYLESFYQMKIFFTSESIPLGEK